MKKFITTTLGSILTTLTHAAAWQEKPNGHDGNDWEMWRKARQTIQAAINLASDINALTGGVPFKKFLQIENTGDRDAGEARALVQKGVVLAVQKNHDALAMFDECVGRFRHSQNPLAREQVATALVERGWWHLQLKNTLLALEDFQECARLYQNDPNPNAREQAARAYEWLEAILFWMGKLDEAETVINKAAKVFENEETVKIREIISLAFSARGGILQSNGDYKGAIKAYDECARWHVEDAGLKFTEEVIHAMMAKGFLLDTMKKYHESLLVYKDCMVRFQNDMDFRALNNFIRNLQSLDGEFKKLKKTEESLEIATMIQEAISNMPDEPNKHSRPPVPRNEAGLKNNGDNDRLVFGIPDAWKQQYGLDTGKDIGEEVCESGLRYWEAYLLGCNPLLRTTNPENAPCSDFEIYMRGFNPLELAPAQKDRLGEVTRFRLGFSGPGARYAMVRIGNAIHAGSLPQEYALRSGERFYLSVERLPNVKGGAGLLVQLEMKPLEGIMTDFSGYWGRYLVPEE